MTLHGRGKGRGCSAAFAAARGAVACLLLAATDAAESSLRLPCRHTHIRAANACYLLCFGGGVALAYMADVVEQLSRRAIQQISRRPCSLR